MLKVNTESILDKPTREAIESLVSALNSLTLLKGSWQTLEATVGSGEELPIPHYLGFTPKDIIITHTSGIGTFEVVKIDSKKVTIKISGISGKFTFRALIGSTEGRL